MGGRARVPGEAARTPSCGCALRLLVAVQCRAGSGADMVTPADGAGARPAGNRAAPRPANEPRLAFLLQPQRRAIPSMPDAWLCQEHAASPSVATRGNDININITARLHVRPPGMRVNTANRRAAGPRGTTRASIRALRRPCSKPGGMGGKRARLAAGLVACFLLAGAPGAGARGRGQYAHGKQLHGTNASEQGWETSSHSSPWSGQPRAPPAPRPRFPGTLRSAQTAIGAWGCNTVWAARAQTRFGLGSTRAPSAGPHHLAAARGRRSQLAGRSRSTQSSAAATPPARGRRWRKPT